MRENTSFRGAISGEIPLRQAYKWRRCVEAVVILKAMTDSAQLYATAKQQLYLIALWVDFVLNGG